MMLKDILPLIGKVTNGQNLTAAQAEQAFRELEKNDVESYFYFAFLAALHAKGETGDELLGFCRANEHFVPRFDVGVDADKIVDISGTGGDRIKTPNISTAAAFVVASKGIAVAKQAFLAVTGLTGSADLLQEFGIDPLAVAREGSDKVRSILSNTGMVMYHGNSMANPENRKGFFSHWLKKVPETGLSFVTAYHLAANAYSPIPMRRRVYGIFDRKHLRPLAELFQKLGYTRGLVCHGTDGLDEVSNVGTTEIAEFSASGIREYEITPEDLGVEKAEIGAILGSSREENILDFLRILYGKETGPKKDLVLINAAAAFYVMNEVPSLSKGTELAAKLLKEGVVANKFEEYVRYCGDPSKLQVLKAAARIAE